MHQLTITTDLNAIIAGIATVVWILTATAALNDGNAIAGIGTEMDAWSDGSSTAALRDILTMVVRIGAMIVTAIHTTGTITIGKLTTIQFRQNTERGRGSAAPAFSFSE